MMFQLLVDVSKVVILTRRNRQLWQRSLTLLIGSLSCARLQLSFMTTDLRDVTHSCTHDIDQILQIRLIL